MQQGVAVEQAFEPEGAFVRLRAALMVLLTLLPALVAKVVVYKKVRQVRSAQR